MRLRGDVYPHVFFFFFPGREDALRMNILCPAVANMGDPRLDISSRSLLVFFPRDMTSTGPCDNHAGVTHCVQRDGQRYDLLPSRSHATNATPVTSLPFTEAMLSLMSTALASDTHARRPKLDSFAMLCLRRIIMLACWDFGPRSTGDGEGYGDAGMRDGCMYV